ncbi:hypothetical protein DPX16_21521 [Anabarilius grahami]|uniref:Uncharacterized protein n=1 Tax=Anabarilius grahami TaxID=495550 RepID=A0A3N0XUN2_ANAGA|nr:hypothetical protein DPX16_21521 [Anabarilius grahami]
MDYSLQFCRLPVNSTYEDETLRSLFWIGANYHHPVDLSDTKGLSLREAIIRCLESVYPQSRPQTDPEPNTQPHLTTEILPEPPADSEQPVTTVPTIAPEQMPQCESDQGCEPATTMPEGILVVLNTEDWLINWHSEVLFPTLSQPESFVCSSSSLFQDSTETCMDCEISVCSSSLFQDSTETVSLTCWEWELSLLIKSRLPLSPSPQSSASPPAPLLLDDCSPSSYPGTPCCDVNPQAVQPPALSESEDPVAPPPVSDSFAPPWPFDLSAPPCSSHTRLHQIP